MAENGHKHYQVQEQRPESLTIPEDGLTREAALELVSEGGEALITQTWQAQCAPGNPMPQRH